MLLASFCAETANIWKVIGYFVVILKIVIPILLIVLGMVDLGKAVISSDEKEMNKAVNMLLKRFIIAVVIFFIPTIISALFNAIHVADGADSNVCIQCITNVGACDTSQVVGEIK